MNLLTSIRKNINTWANTSLSVFIVAWLSLIIAPCMMAMGAPAKHMAMENSSTHMSMHAETEESQDINSDVTPDDNDKKSCCDDDCPRKMSQDIPQEMDISCHSNDLDCTTIDNYLTQVDQPKHKNKLANNSLDDFNSPTAIVNTQLTDELSPLDEPAQNTRLTYTPHYSGTALNDLYCVYLI